MEVCGQRHAIHVTVAFTNTVLFLDDCAGENTKILTTTCPLMISNYLAVYCLTFCNLCSWYSIIRSLRHFYSSQRI